MAEIISMRDALARAAAADCVDGSEDQLATDFSHRHDAELRYCHLWGRWLRWDGTRWRPEQTKAVIDLMRAVCHDYAVRLDDKSIGSRRSIAGAIELASADRRHAALPEIFDRDPWLLNTPAGTIDLRTGAIRGHRQSDYITRITATEAGGRCPLWCAFLEEIMAGDNTRIAYMQRLAGYCLTGSVREHALFFCYGTGANGKSVFLGTLGAILGEYADVAPMATFLASKFDSHPTDIADLRGVRLVTAQETPEDRNWDAAKLKAVTGGDRIKARFMRQDFFAFNPQCKLLFGGNNKPGLRSVDEAIRRRLHLIPFEVTIAPEKRDRDLLERLKAEWPGILQWTLDGCRHWLERGLDPPPVISEATRAYFEAEDALGRWLEERCMFTTGFTASAVLFEDWKTWTEREGEFSGGPKSFGNALEKRGFVRDRIGGRRGFQKIGIRA